MVFSGAKGCRWKGGREEEQVSSRQCRETERERGREGNTGTEREREKE